MSKATTIKSTVTLAFGRNRIGLSKKALALIGSPKYILLLVNPEERILVILCSDEKEQRAHRIHPTHPRPELHSKNLLMTLFGLKNNWQADCSYTISGEVFLEEHMIKVHIDKAVPSATKRNSENAD